MACVDMALALPMRAFARGVWGMLPQENFSFIDCVSDAFLRVKVRYLDV